MNKKLLYDSIYLKNINRIRNGDIKLDDWLCNTKNDKHVGISLIIPINGFRKEYKKLVKALFKYEPDQYYYPYEDLHITIFDFIKAHENYIDNIKKEQQFVTIVNSLQTNLNPFDIELNGIVFTHEAGIIKGFDNDELIKIRKAIRERMVRLEIKNDERYKSESAHITFFRFKSRIKNTERLINFMDRNKESQFGVKHINKMELVVHDWYNRKKKRRIIKSFEIKW